MGPSLETGAIFDAALSGNYCAFAIRVSVMAVQEKCDEKGRSVRFGKAHARDGRGIPPFSQSALKGWGPRHLVPFLRSIWCNAASGVKLTFQPLHKVLSLLHVSTLRAWSEAACFQSGVVCPQSHFNFK